MFLLWHIKCMTNFVLLAVDVGYYFFKHFEP